MPPEIVKYGVYAIAGIFFIIVVKLFATPMRFIFKLILNAVLGFFALVLFNLAGSLVGVTLGLNVINTVIVAILGVPGLILLLLVRLIIGT